MEFEKPNQALQNMKTELENIQNIDLFSYFSRVSKSAEDAADKMKSITTVADMIGNKFETAFMSAVKGTASMKVAKPMAIKGIKLTLTKLNQRSCRIQSPPEYREKKTPNSMDAHNMPRARQPECVTVNKPNNTATVAKLQTRIRIQPLASIGHSISGT